MKWFKVPKQFNKMTFNKWIIEKKKSKILYPSSLMYKHCDKLKKEKKNKRKGKNREKKRMHATKE